MPLGESGGALAGGIRDGRHRGGRHRGGRHCGGRFGDGRHAMTGTVAGGSATPGTAASASATANTVAGGPAAAGPTADRSRRAVLAAAAASLPLLAVAGCKGIGALATPPRPAPDVALLRAAIARSPGLAAGLRPLRAEHRLHLAEFRSRLIVPPGSAAASAASPAPASSGASPGASGAPARTAAAISFLQGAERVAAAELLRRLTAVSPSLAQLMASVAASEATHVAALAAVRGSGRT